MRFRPGQTARVIHDRTVLDTRNVSRRIIPGDILTVVAHTPGEGVVRCLQGGPARCVLKVPAESLRVVPAGDVDGGEGEVVDLVLADAA